jgi:hypothetical protein
VGTTHRGDVSRQGRGDPLAREIEEALHHPYAAKVGEGRQVACHLRVSGRRLTDAPVPSMTAS